MLALAIGHLIPHTVAMQDEVFPLSPVTETRTSVQYSSGHETNHYLEACGFYVLQWPLNGHVGDACLYP